MFNLKVNGLREGVLELINSAAEHLQLYDKRLPEDAQATGYHVFRTICTMKEQVCTLNDFEEYKKNSNFYNSEAPVGYYLLSQIHPLARKKVLDAANKIRKILSKGEATKYKIQKKYR